MTITEILALADKYSPALQAFDEGRATVADAKLADEVYTLLKDYFADIQDKSRTIIRVRETLEAAMGNMPEEKRTAILAIIDGK